MQIPQLSFSPALFSDSTAVYFDNIELYLHCNSMLCFNWFTNISDMNLDHQNIDTKMAAQTSKRNKRTKKMPPLCILSSL